MKEELKEYYCLNDYIMECPGLKGKAAFLKGKKYLFNNKMITKSEVYNEHDLSDEIDFDKHFILQSEWDLLQQKSGKLPKQQLIGMTAFVLKQYKLFIQDKITSEQFRNNVWNYANFLSRQPQLSDFVPCGKDGLPLEMPIIYDGMDSDALLDEKKYLQALDKVLFKGFEVFMDNEDFTRIKLKDKLFITFYKETKEIVLNAPYADTKEIKTLESLTPYNQRQT